MISFLLNWKEGKFLSKIKLSSPYPDCILGIETPHYYVRHEAETHENRRFLSTGVAFAENAYAYVLKAPSRS